MATTLVKVRGISQVFQEISETKNGSSKQPRTYSNSNSNTISFGNGSEPVIDSSMPVASNEDAVPVADRIWGADPCDDLLPKNKGFINDLVYYTRGREVPTIFMIWAGLFCISSGVKRESWLKWADNKLYPNVYAMIIAPPGAAKKNTVIDIVIKLLDYLDDEIEDENIKQMKMINPFMSKATPEALITSMTPGNKRGKKFTFKDKDGKAILKDGKPVEYVPGSDLAITQHEMSTLVGKQTYMEGFIEHLMNWYDCHDRWANATQTRGSEDLINLYVTFLAALTPVALKNMPPSVSGDGFLSRTMMVYQAFTEREFDEPLIPEGAPDTKELRRRLGWIVSNTMGEWTFSPEAKAYKKIVYHRFKTKLGLDGAYQGVKSRLDIIVNKVSMLISWQEYKKRDNVISLDALFDAEYLVYRTFEEGTPMYQHVLNEGSSDLTVKVGDYIKRKAVIARVALLKNSHIPSDTVNQALVALWQENKVRVYTAEGTVAKKLTFKNSDLYVWIGDRSRVIKGSRERFGLTDEVVAYYNKYSMAQILRDRDGIDAQEQAMIDIVLSTTVEENAHEEEKLIENHVKDIIAKHKLKLAKTGKGFYGADLEKFHFNDSAELARAGSEAKIEYDKDDIFAGE